MKKVFFFSIALLFSIVLGIVAPRFFNENNITDLNNVSVINQKVTGYSDTNTVIYKIYDGSSLLGVVKNKDKLNQSIKNYDFDTDYSYDIDSVRLTENIYIVEELSKMLYEDIDQNILKYLVDNECIGIETTSVIFSTDKGVSDKIYIDNEDDFSSAKDRFVLNFISQETINKINSGQKINSPLSYGSVETGINISEKIEFSKGVTSPNNILKSEEEIYQYLCYGRNTERQYYTVIEGDTLPGVGYHFGNMSAKQIMMLNPDIIKSETQLLEPGTVLNVTYYTSPLHVAVIKERLAQETKYPDPIRYEDDPNQPIGYIKVVQEEKNGIKNVLYKETWINGVRQENLTDRVSEYTAIESSQGIVMVGKGTIVTGKSAGSGNWRWPVQNPTITCNYYCYANHGGVDFYNLYNPWDYVLAIDSGVVVDTGWTNLGGYYARIDHNNGYVTYYGHFSSMPTVEKGQSVSAGEVLGPIGMTGNATGPHVHLAMYDNGTLIDPCTVLNCSILY